MMGSELKSFRIFDFLRSKAWSSHCNDSPDFGKHQLEAFRRRRTSGSLTKINYCVCPHGGLYIPELLELHKQVRERRRSRSNSTTGRSRTPSSVSSGRTTPSPGPSSLLSPLNGRTMSDDSLSQTRINSPQRFLSSVPRKYTTVCWLEPRNVPVHYSSTVLITLGSTRKRYTEDVRFQTRLTTRRFSESVEMPVSRYCVSTIEIPCNTYNNMFDGELLQVPSDSEA